MPRGKSGRLPEPGFWRGRRVLVTGHTGFKGAWLALWLRQLGADVRGYALGAPTTPCLFDLTDPIPAAAALLGDVRDGEALRQAVRDCAPAIVFHFAAQSLVLESIRDPVGTFATNVMGTVNMLDALREVDGLQAVIVATSDKVYANSDSGRNFTENDALGGEDPYSASKAATEHAVASFRRSYFVGQGVPVLCVRAGNVIGGGDWAPDRLIPDLFRAITGAATVAIRNPRAVRPWQHVLEPLRGYLLAAEAMVEASEAMPAALNFGPGGQESLTVLEVAQAFLAEFGAGVGRHCVVDAAVDTVEKQLLRLDAGLAHDRLGWSTVLTERDAVQWTARWYERFRRGQRPLDLCHADLAAYAQLMTSSPA